MLQNFLAEQTIARLPNIFTADGYQRSRRRLVQTAEKRSRHNVYTARARLIQTAVERFTNLCYQRFDDSVRLANVGRGGKILTPVPWGWRYCHEYGLNRTDAQYLRWEMLGRCLPEMDHVSLFMFDRGRWHVDLRAYPQAADGFQYWQDYPIVASTIAGFERVRT